MRDFYDEMKNSSNKKKKAAQKILDISIELQLSPNELEQAVKICLSMSRLAYDNDTFVK